MDVVITVLVSLIGGGMETRSVGADCLTTLDHLNTMVRRAESETAPDLNFSIHGIQRYCSGQLDPTTDAGAISVPDSINRLLSHLENRHRADLGADGAPVPRQ